MPREEEGPFSEPLVSVPTTLTDWRVPAHEAVRRMAISTNAGPDYVKDTFGGDIANAPADRAEAVRQVIERQRTDGQRLADHFDALPEIAVVEQIERDGETWLLYATDGPIAFPLSDALIERQAHLIGNLPGKDGVSDYTRLMTGEAIHVSWRVEHKDGVVTKLEVMLDGKVFVPDWGAAHEAQAQLSELKKTQPTVETKPTEQPKKRSNLGPTMAAFNKQCEAFGVPSDQPVRDNIRHMASNGASWGALPEDTNWGELLAATRKIMETGVWKDDPDGSRREFSQITEERESPIGENEPEAKEEQVVPISKEKTMIEHNYQPVAVWPHDHGQTVYKGIRFSVTLYAPDATWDDAVRLMEQFAAHPEALHPSCRVTAQQPAPTAPLPSAQQSVPPQQQAPATQPQQQNAGKQELTERVGMIKRERDQKTDQLITGLYVKFGANLSTWAVYRIKDDDSGWLNSLYHVTGKRWYEEPFGAAMTIEFPVTYTLGNEYTKKNGEKGNYHNLVSIPLPAPAGPANPNEPF